MSNEKFKNEQELFEHLLSGGIIGPKQNGGTYSPEGWLHIAKGRLVYYVTGRPVNSILLGSGYWVTVDRLIDEPENLIGIPCGLCDMGLYSEQAFYNRKAREFSCLETEERHESMPCCKKFDRECVGARRLSDAIDRIDGK